MLKCDIKDNKINFDELEVGATFIVKDEVDSREWIGMKVASAIDWEEHSYYILDLSSECGDLYDDVDMYNIVDIVDLKVVRDEN